MLASRRYWKDESATSAAEFALVVIPFLALVFAIIGTSMMLYSNQTLQYAAEAAARCASVSSATTCDTPTHIQTYATNHYSGPAISPAFVYTATGCGHTVTATASIPLNAVVVNISVPLNASACFP